MKYIKLFNKNINIIVDDEDYEYLKQFKWISRQGYAARHISSRPKQKYLYMHHEILKTLELIDHVNGNIQDNRKSNLRIANKQKNAANCKIHKHNTSGYKGVSYIKSLKKYRAYIVHNNRQMHLGVFKTAKEAAQAYNKKAIEIFGEFARLNEKINITNKKESRAD